MKDQKKERILTILRDVYSNLGKDINKLNTGENKAIDLLSTSLLFKLKRINSLLLSRYLYQEIIPHIDKKEKRDECLKVFKLALKYDLPLNISS